MRTAQMRKNISNGCQRVIKNGKEKKQYIGVRAPYGYQLDKNTKKLVIDKKTAFIVYLIFDLYDKGLGLTTIAQYLNERMIAPPTIYKRTGEYILPKLSYLKWEKGAVRQILQNKVYNGRYKYSVEDTHYKIINDQMWNRVSLRKKEKRNRGGVDHYDHNGNEFCNLVYCACCNKPFTIEKSKCKEGITSYLRCSSYDKRGNTKYHCDNKLAIKYSELRDIVGMFVKKEIFDNISIDSLQEDYFNKIKNNDDNEIAIHREYLKQERNELIRLKNKYENIYFKKDDSLITQVNKENKKNMIDNINNRLIEVDNLKKQIYSFARTTAISDKEFYIDRLTLDTFVSKINIGVLENNKREILINLK